MHNQRILSNGVLNRKRFISNVFHAVGDTYRSIGIKRRFPFVEKEKRQKCLFPSTGTHKPKRTKSGKKGKNLHAIYTKRLIFRSKLFHFSRTRGTTLVSVDRSSKLDGNERLGRMEFELREREREKKKRKFYLPER